ncbi:MAG TPA: amidase, partial [Cellulomonas sp.]|nr:amidase [Cellulomonas sp.]
MSFALPRGTTRSVSSRCRRFVPFAASAAAAALLLPLVATAPASALTSVTSAQSVTWNVNDSRRPGLDTGSIRNISNSTAEGLGNIFVHVDGDNTPRMNDQMLRGFGLTKSGAASYDSTQSVRLGDLLVTRRLQINPATDVATFFDTFTNTATRPLSVDVSFGGSLGYGTGSNAGVVNATSDGDAEIEPGESWATAGGTGTTRPTGLVVGSPAPFAGGTTRIGDQQQDPFTVDYTTTGSKANNPGFVNSLTVAPGTTQSLVRFVVVGARGDTTNIQTTTAALAATPDFSSLSPDELCTVTNWDLTAVSSFNPAVCAGAEPLQLPAAPVEAPAGTSVEYDVNGKTIAQLQADMRAGVVTSAQVTQAYLDRIDAYDGGQLGFNAFISVADNALEQARAADKARAAGKDTDLLGVPIALKDLYDTKDQATTGGTLALKSWQPATDAWQVAKLREAGAVLIGKTNLSEFANSGSWSESGFKQTWNALYPSKSSFGSSGGSAVATATSMAAAAMGTQTGVSLYAPTTGASLTAFRGTDGLTSTEGVMPLTWGQDYAGPIAKSVTDLAILLDATATQATGNDPADIITNRVDNAKRPVEWKTSLRADALQGKKIGYVPSSFTSTAIADDTTGQVTFEHVKAALEAAGATLVEMTGSPSTSTGISVSGSAGAEGWERYIAAHDGEGFPFASPKGLLESAANLPYNVSTNYTSVGMDDVNTENYLARRDAYKVNTDAWMSTNGAESVDAVIYAGFISGVGNNDATSATLSSDRATGVLTSNLGLPTVILPIGTNEAGQSNSIQIVGRAWDDASILGMGYALEQQ